MVIALLSLRRKEGHEPLFPSHDNFPSSTFFYIVSSNDRYYPMHMHVLPDPDPLRFLSASQEDVCLSGRTRTKDKYRVVYSDHQRLELEKEFHYSRYITIRRKSELAQALSLSERQVIRLCHRYTLELKYFKYSLFSGENLVPKSPREGAQAHEEARRAYPEGEA